MKLLPEAVTNKVGRQLLHLQKASPKVMFYAGVTGVVASTVLACRATLKVSTVLAETEDLKAKSEMLHIEHDMDPMSNDYDETKYNKDQMVLKVKTILNVTKLYAPSAGLMMISIGLLTGSHVTLNKRNASLTAAYASVDQAFEKYRQRVVAQLGKDADDEFRYGADKFEEVVLTGKDGEKTKTIVKKRASAEGHSMYARFFDQTSTEWQRGAEYNRAFLQCQQNYWNERLRIKGHVFLNEVYDALGIERSPQGAVVGWVLGKKSEGHTGDNCIDFGIFDDLTNPNVRDFVNGAEDAILLDFNVDGVVYDKI